jgi:hypothetical protein
MKVLVCRSIATCTPFRRFPGDANVRRAFMPRLYVAILHGTLSFYHRDALILT